MRPLLLFLMLMLPVTAQAQQPDTTAEAQARAFLDLLVQEQFDAAFARFEPRMAQAMPVPTLGQTWQTIKQQVGSVQEVREARVDTVMGLRAVTLVTQFERALVHVRVVLDEADRVTGLFFQPAPPPAPAAAPPYADRTKFEERAVTIRPDSLSLPGTLSLPTGDGPFPLVILVHGSGPNDRDETVGPNKPFRDLAWGLASNGVAVLRYEKRSRAHPQTFAGTPFTVNEEVIADVFAAVALARSLPEIDRERVYVLGHSLGGMLLPRIGQRDAEDRHIAGLISLAGAARPLETIVPEQLRYLAALDARLDAAEQQQITAMDSVLTRIAGLTEADRDDLTPLIGAPAAYWLDLRGYDPPAVARTLHHPMLILHGGRDYQVTNADFNRWTEALADRINVSFKVYPTLNHLFISGEGRSSPQEYQQPGHVDPEVILDIAGWIR